jgi:phosphoribosylaminoimidazole carboxylase (NCAIR synthetase)
MQKAPAYQWYPKDYDTDEAVKLMTYEQEGIYRRLLDHQSLHGSIPSDPTAIAKLVPKVSAKRFLTLWPAMAGKFPTVEDRRANQKLERVKADFAAFMAGRSLGGRRSAQLRLALYGTAQPPKPPP